MTFRDPILAGDQLIRESIQSPNYVAGASGWTVNRDGSAEFNNLAVRGSFSTGVAPNPYVKIFDTGTTAEIDVSSGDPTETAPAVIYASKDFGAGVFLTLRSPSTGHQYSAMKLLGETATQRSSIEFSNTGPNTPGPLLAKVFGDLFVSGSIYTDASWSNVAFQNSWVNFGSGFQTVQYRKIGSQVFLRGMMGGGTINAAAFTLPAGYRPLATLRYAIVAADAFAEIEIATTGVVTQKNGSNVWGSLSGVSFFTD